MDTLLGVLAVFVLVFLNGFFVSAEFAFVGARRTRIAQLAAEGNAGAKAAQEAIRHLDSYIAATQLGITLASLGLGWIGEPAVAHVIEPILEAILPHETAENLAPTISVVLGFSLVTTLHIVFGELAPKSIALQRPESTSIMVARPTALFLNLFRPIIWLMNGIGNAVVRMLGFEPAGGHSQVHSAEELEMLVQSSREAGYLQESEEVLLRRVFDFSDIEVQEIMQPRVEVDAIGVETPLKEVLDKVSAQHHSRYPVYAESIDNVIGILHTKDLLDVLVRQPDVLVNGGDFRLDTVLRAPLFVPETVSVDRVLEQMQRTSTHFVIVIDEYGGMAGVATMEDIIEELVGEVQDEFDLENAPIVTKGNVAVVDGLVTMADAIERFGDPGETYLSTTVGGYVAERLERIPQTGDEIRFGIYTVRVEEMEGMRVARLRFTRRPVALPADAGDAASSGAARGADDKGSSGDRTDSLAWPRADR